MKRQINSIVAERSSFVNGRSATSAWIQLWGVVVAFQVHTAVPFLPIPFWSAEVAQMCYSRAAPTATPRAESLGISASFVIANDGVNARSSELIVISTTRTNVHAPDSKAGYSDIGNL